MLRFRRYTMRGITRWQPQWRKRRRDPWRDVFISSFDDASAALLWARREYGRDAQIAEPRP